MSSSAKETHQDFEPWSCNWRPEGTHSLFSCPLQHGGGLNHSFSLNSDPHSPNPLESQSLNVDLWGLHLEQGIACAVLWRKCLQCSMCWAPGISTTSLSYPGQVSSGQAGGTRNPSCPPFPPGSLAEPTVPTSHSWPRMNELLSCLQLMLVSGLMPKDQRVCICPVSPGMEAPSCHCGAGTQSQPCW